MKKNVFDTVPLVATGVVVLIWICRYRSLSGIIATLLAAVFIVALIWYMRTTFDTETGEISCVKMLRDRFFVSDITSAVIRQYPKGAVLELTVNDKERYHIWRRCQNMHEFETFLQSNGIQIQQT